MELPEGASFPVRTTADVWPVVVLGLGEKPRLREGKVTPDGEPTYTTGAIFKQLDKEGNSRSQKGVSIHVVKPAAVYEEGTRYYADGTVFVQPYQPDGGRFTYSITCERLVPESEKRTPQPPQQPREQREQKS